MGTEVTSSDKELAQELQELLEKYDRAAVFVIIDRNGKSILMSAFDRKDTIRQLKEAYERMIDNTDEVWSTKEF